MTSGEGVATTDGGCPVGIALDVFRGRWKADVLYRLCTAFRMSEESRMAANVKEAVLKANAKDLLLFRTIPAYYRSLPGALANKLVEMDRAGATNEELGKAMGGFANLRKGMLEGDMENGYVSVGHAISFIHEIMSSAQIIADMTQDWRSQA